jgi:hypothetical protein
MVAGSGLRRVIGDSEQALSGAGYPCVERSQQSRQRAPHSPALCFRQPAGASLLMRAKENHVRVLLASRLLVNLFSHRASVLE